MFKTYKFQILRSKISQAWWPGLQSEFQDSQGYTEKPCLEKPKKKKKKKRMEKQTEAVLVECRETNKPRESLQLTNGLWNMTCWQG
jgi:hypothetical protein